MRSAHSSQSALGKITLLLCGLLVCACEVASGKESPAQSSGLAGGARAPAVSPPTSSAQERMFFHLSQGSDFLPVCALRLHLKEEGSAGSTALADYFKRYGLIADPVQDKHNPLGLPIGVTLSEGRSMAGFNCAACHVARIPDDVTGQIVVGAPGRFDIRQFYNDMVGWLAPMLDDRRRAAKVLGCMVADALQHALTSAREKLSAEERQAAEELAAFGDDEKQAVREIASLGTEKEYAPLEVGSETKAAEASGRFKALSRAKRAKVLGWLKREVSNRVRLLKARQDSLGIVAQVGEIDHTRPGPGRVDAFMTALNLLQQQTKLPMTSPVAYPPLWGTSTLPWLHYDGNTNAALERNMGQSLGVGGVFVRNTKDPKKIDATSVNPHNLVQLEGVLKQMTAPRWPFGAIDTKLVEQGKQIYVRERCGRCHDPDKNGVVPELPLGPLSADDDPKTDRARLDNFEKLVTGTPAIHFLKQRLDALAATAPDALRDKEPAWRTTRRYAPRALAGVWATAPYLHNDSVPTLWDLFSTRRPDAFSVDNTRYDTTKVGYVTAPSGAFVLKTSEPGNGNQGHPWGTKLETNEPEKRALIEYLKQL